jgi:hypothetical protein
MAKSKLTKQAIRFLVDTYDDETTNHTFHEVRKMIEDKFKITVTYEAIRKSYHANKNALSAEDSKDNKVADGNGVNPMLSTEAKKPSVSMSKLRDIVKGKSTSKKDFDTSYEDITTEELNYLFSSSEND